MQKHFLPLIILLELAVAAPAAADDEPLIIFTMKNFTDTGDAVHVEGTLPGPVSVTKIIGRCLPATTIQESA